MNRGPVGGQFAGGVAMVAEVMPDRSRPFALGWLQALSAIGNMMAATISIVLGKFEEKAGFHSIGSGSLFARSALKKIYDPDGDREAAIRNAVEALYDAADDDTATGGPDLIRKIYPVVMTATAEGNRRLTDEEAAEVTEAVVERRRENPGG